MPSFQQTRSHEADHATSLRDHSEFDPITFAAAINAGAAYSSKNSRVALSEFHNTTCLRVGGHEKLIHILNPGLMSEPIRVHHIPRRTLQEVQTMGGASLGDFNPEDGIAGVLEWDASKNIGKKGAFKTAHYGYLTLHGAYKGDGLGKVKSERVAVKQAYQPVMTSDGKPSERQIQRLTPNAQLEFMAREGSTMMWAGALWDSSEEAVKKHWKDGYVTITNAESLKRSPGGLGLEMGKQIKIPTLRWVDAAIGFISRSGGDTLTVLLEELIPQQPQKKNEITFWKYVHNTDCKPIGRAGTPENLTALYLAFIQHIQWEMTQGLAYTSDFQGFTSHLSLSLSHFL
jgi:hypothetical protein